MEASRDSASGASEVGEESMTEKIKGTVKWFNDAKGFGFIEGSEGGDVFVHYSVIESEGFKTLTDGEEVLYEITEGPKGLHAVKVERPNAPKRAKRRKKDGSEDDSDNDSELIASESGEDDEDESSKLEEDSDSGASLSDPDAPEYEEH